MAHAFHMKVRLITGSYEGPDHHMIFTVDQIATIHLSGGYELADIKMKDGRYFKVCEPEEDINHLCRMFKMQFE